MRYKTILKTKIAIALFCLVLSDTSNPLCSSPQPEIDIANSKKQNELKTGESPILLKDFQDADIRDFIRFVSEITGKNFVIDPRVKGLIALVVPNHIPRNELFDVFLSVLEVHGYTIVEAGGYEQDRTFSKSSWRGD